MYEEAREISDRLIERHPDDLQCLAYAAEAAENLAASHAEAGRHDTAIESFGQARRIRERLLKRSGGSPRHDYGLSFVLGNLASTYRKANRLNDCLQTARQALKLNRALLARHARSIGFRQAARANLIEIGRMHVAASRRREAREALDEAVQISDRLLAENPTVLRFVNDAAWAHFWAAAACGDEPRLELQHLGRVVSLLTPALKSSSWVRHRELLFRAHTARARRLEQLKQDAQAAEDWAAGAKAAPKQWVHPFYLNAYRAAFLGGAYRRALDLADNVADSASKPHELVGAAMLLFCPHAEQLAADTSPANRSLAARFCATRVAQSVDVRTVQRERGARAVADRACVRRAARRPRFQQLLQAEPVKAPRPR